MHFRIRGCGILVSLCYLYTHPGIQSVDAGGMRGNLLITYTVLFKSGGHVEGETLMWPIHGYQGTNFGDCFIYVGHTFGSCLNENDLHLSGHRKFRCLTPLTAEMLRKERRDETRKTGQRALPFFNWTGHL